MVGRHWRISFLECPCRLPIIIKSLPLTTVVKRCAASLISKEIDASKVERRIFKYACINDSLI